MIAALLLAIQPSIDYTCVAKPLPTVLAILSERTGVEMKATEGLQDQLLVMHLKGAEIETVRIRIAEAVSGKWEFRDGKYVLQVDEIEKKRRYSAWAGRVLFNGTGFAAIGTKAIPLWAQGLIASSLPPLSAGSHTKAAIALHGVWLYSLFLIGAMVSMDL